MNDNKNPWVLQHHRKLTIFTNINGCYPIEEYQLSSLFEEPMLGARSGRCSLTCSMGIQRLCSSCMGVSIYLPDCRPTGFREFTEHIRTIWLLTNSFIQMLARYFRINEVTIFFLQAPTVPARFSCQHTLTSYCSILTITVDTGSHSRLPVHKYFSQIYINRKLKFITSIHIWPK